MPRNMNGKYSFPCNNQCQHGNYILHRAKQPNSMWNIIKVFFFVDERKHWFSFHLILHVKSFQTYSQCVNMKTWLDSQFNLKTTTTTEAILTTTTERIIKPKRIFFVQFKICSIISISEQTKRKSTIKTMHNGCEKFSTISSNKKLIEIIINQYSNKYNVMQLKYNEMSL